MSYDCIRCLSETDNDDDVCDACKNEWREFEAFATEREKSRALTARVAELEGALKFYADKNSWRSPTIYMCGHRGKAQVDIDGGERARAALAKKPPDAL